MKSFSEMTKEELCRTENKPGCCDTAELAGMLLFGCSVSLDEIKLVTENADVYSRFVKLSGVKGEGNGEKASRFVCKTDDKDEILRILEKCRIFDSQIKGVKYRIDYDLIENECCRRAFVKGAFLGGGTVINPQKNYNLEFVTPYMNLSRELCLLLNQEGFMFKTVTRKSKYVLYIKNSEAIQDILSYIGAYKSQMELINIKIEKEIRNDVTRSINSETANYEKTIGASVKQIQAIELIEKKMKLSELPDELLCIAKLRLENKALSLTELGRKCNPPLGKSGVNHRMQKIMAIAEKLED